MFFSPLARQGVHRLFGAQLLQPLCTALTVTQLAALLPVCTPNLQILINAFLERGQGDKVGHASSNGSLSVWLWAGGHGVVQPLLTQAGC